LPNLVSPVQPDNLGNKNLLISLHTEVPDDYLIWQ
jgi:hypothetical protein